MSLFLFPFMTQHPLWLSFRMPTTRLRIISHNSIREKQRAICPNFREWEEISSPRCSDRFLDSPGAGYPIRTFQNSKFLLIHYSNFKKSSIYRFLFLSWDIAIFHLWGLKKKTTIRILISNKFVMSSQIFQFLQYSPMLEYIPTFH